MAFNTTITFNGYTLTNTTYIPESTTHDSSYERDVNSYKIARRHGEKFVSAWYGKKSITISLLLRSMDRTLRESDAVELRTRFVEAAKVKFGAFMRDVK